MTVLQVEDGQVSTQDSVASSHVPSGRELRDGYLDGIGEVTFGLVHARGSSIYIGPLELLRFGAATVTGSAVEWPIEGGITARAPGGHFRIEAAGGRLTASIDRYRPRLPLPIYAMTQLPVHHLLTRLLLLRARGREPAPGIAATRSDRRRAAAVDIAFCATLSGLAGRRMRLRALLGIAAAYHVACWSISGRTLGGLVVGQRVVGVDGSRPTVMQSTYRLLLLPISWVTNRPIHDELAGTDVVESPAP
jgi:RDD family